MKSKIYIIMFSCFMLKLGNVGEIPIYKMRTNEEIVIAKYVKELVNSHN